MRTLTAFFTEHPRLASWIVLSIGMVSDSAPGRERQGAACLASWPGWPVACVVFAGICAWIIGWE